MSYWVFIVLIASVGIVDGLKVGVLYSGTGIFRPYGLTVPIISETFIQATNLHRPTPIIPIYCDVQSNATMAALCASSVLAQGAQVIIAPETFLTTPVALIAQQQSNVPVIASMAASSDVFFTEGPYSKNTSRRFNNLFGVMTPSQFYFSSLLPYLKQQELNTIAFLSLSTIPDKDVCDGAIRVATNLRMSIVSSIIRTLPDIDNVVLKDAIHNLQKSKPDILVTCDRLSCADIMSEMKRQGYSPQALAMFECATTVSQWSSRFDVREAAKFILTPLQWDSRLQGLDFSDSPNKNYANLFPFDVNDANATLTSAQQFQANIISKLPIGTSLSSLAAPQMAAWYVLDAALAQCQHCNDSVSLTNVLTLTYFRSFFGVVRFDENGQNDAHEMTIVQVDNSYQLQILSPLASQTTKPIIPIPTFAERVYTNVQYGSKTEKWVLSVTITCLLFDVIMGVVIWIYRESPSIKGTSYRFLLLSLFGCMLLNLATLTWRLENTALDCHFRPLLFILGAVTMTSPWIAKTFRIYQIFNHDRIQRRSITDSQVATYTLICATPLMLVMIAWYVIAPLSLQRVQVDILRPKYDYFECISNGDQSVIFLWLSLAFYLLMLVIGSVMAYMTRSVHATFNDSKATAWALYNILLWMIVILLTLNMIEDRAGAMIVRSTGVLLCTTFCVILFAERIYSFETTVVSNDRSPYLQQQKSSGNNNAVAPVPSSIVIPLPEQQKQQQHPFVPSLPPPLPLPSPTTTAPITTPLSQPPIANSTSSPSIPKTSLLAPPLPHRYSHHRQVSSG